ncbi:hypothetical protein [Microbacterium lacus]|uniref:Uncharacterized protein n=1 Tax=Microbacterium lacus TaxID=415217 RepID=A0ABN2G9U0_9MICO
MVLTISTGNPPFREETHHLEGEPTISGENPPSREGTHHLGGGTTFSGENRPSGRAGAESREKVVAPSEINGLLWKALVRATRGRPPKEDAMHTIAVTVTPVAAVLRDPFGTTGILG